ncbi:MAG: hypothetical protein IT377_24075 [Polyangiaceae bacterium]|nr:hypothetical protein [Polyangiaceae bacterium]
MLRRFLIPGLALTLLACGGETSSDPGSAGGGGGTATGGAAGSGAFGGDGGSAALGGGGGSAGSGGGSGGAECVQQGDGWPAGTDPSCADLGVLAVDSPTLSDADGDGGVSCALRPS